MTTREQIVGLREEADNFALKALSCEGEYHPDFHEVSDERFYTIAFAAGAASAKPEVAIAEAFRCGEESRDAEIAELVGALEHYAAEDARNAKHYPPEFAKEALAKVRKP